MATTVRHLSHRSQLAHALIGCVRQGEKFARSGFVAIGWGGQRLYLVAALELAVVMMAGNSRLPIREQGRTGNTLILDLVLPSLG